MIVETITGLMAVFTVLFYGITPYALMIFGFQSALLAGSAIDYKHEIIPDSITIPGTLIGLCCAAILPELKVLDSLTGILAGGGVFYIIAEIYYRLTGKDGLGGGDIKLMAMIGAFLGLRGVIFTIFFSSVTGLAVMVPYLLVAGDIRRRIPFGPFLAAAAILYIYVGEAIFNWYLNGTIYY